MIFTHHHRSRHEQRRKEALASTYNNIYARGEGYASSLQKDGHIEWKIEDIILTTDVSTTQHNGTMDVLAVFTEGCVKRCMTEELFTRLHFKDGNLILLFDDEVEFLTAVLVVIMQLFAVVYYIFMQLFAMFSGANIQLFAD